MSPTQLNHQQQNGKKEMTTTTTSNSNGNGGLCGSPPLKVRKNSHMIKKSSSSSSSSSAASSLGIVGTTKPLQQQRHPVIIYTHSPKVIHTHPKYFMALVQKLTGLSRNAEDEDLHNHHQNQVPNHNNNQPNNKAEKRTSNSAEEDGKQKINFTNDDNESSSVITDENCEGHVNSSCFGAAGGGGGGDAPPLFEAPAAPPFLTNIPVFTPNSAEFLCMNHHQPFYNHTDSLFFTPNIRNSISSSSGLEGMNHEFRGY